MVGSRRVDQERKVQCSVPLPPRAGPARRPVSRIGEEAILEQGVDTIFGYIEASVLPLFTRLYGVPTRRVARCHQQDGGHMPDAYARERSKVDCSRELSKGLGYRSRVRPRIERLESSRQKVETN